MLVNPIAASVSTPVEAGARVVSKVAATHKVSAVNDETTQQRRESDAKETPPAAERKALQDAADKLNEHFTLPRSELHFHVDEDSKRLVVTVLDARDGTVIRQLPSEEALRLAQALQHDSESPALLKQIA